jgi:hypothetical protein
MTLKGALQFEWHGMHEWNCTLFRTVIEDPNTLYQAREPKGLGGAGYEGRGSAILGI